MKVAIVIEQLDLEKGGQERSTYEFAERLAEKGINPTILTSSSSKIPDNHQCEIIDFEIKVRSNFRRFKKFHRQAVQYIQNHSFDIVHSITPITLADIYQPRGGLIDETRRQNIMRRKGMSKILKMCFSLNARQRAVRKKERYLARKTNCKFLAVSDYVRRQFAEHLDLTGERSEVIFNAVNIERLNSTPDNNQREHTREVLKIKPEQLVGVFVANNFGLKGLGSIIETSRILKNSDPELLNKFKFLIAGTDKVRKWFNKVQKYSLQDSILFTGPVQNVTKLYGISDFLIHPTWYDPCSRVVLEAIACKLPVITSRYNGASELIRQANCGYIIRDPSDCSELKEYLSGMRNDEVRKKFSENMISMKEQISMNRLVIQMIESYNSVRKNK